ncbi:MAG: hypothetical protein JNK40_05320 [Chromatiales bacterium]|nr:hypothetical protein [Chromatiales bacterium]
MRGILLVIVLGMLAACGSPPPTVDLLIPVNAKCTTCEDFIRCDGGIENAAVYDPSFDLYRLEPKGILAQLATVWEFLIQLFHTRTEDLRPLSVYAQRPGESSAFNRTITKGLEARTDLVAHRIHLPSGWIDQVTGDWHGTDDSRRGACRLLKPAEGREVLKLFAEPATGDPS